MTDQVLPKAALALRLKPSSHDVRLCHLLTLPRALEDPAVKLLSLTQAIPPLHRLSHGSPFLSWPPKPQSPSFPPLQPPHPGPRHPWERGHPWHLKFPTFSYLRLLPPFPVTPSFQPQTFCFLIPLFHPSPEPHEQLPASSGSLGFPGGSDCKVSACNAGDLGSIPGSGRSPEEGNGSPLQYSCLENSMD